MARPTVAARRYAEAVLEIARRDGTFDAWLADLRQAATVVMQPDISRVVNSPAVAYAARRAILTGLLEPRISKPALNLVILLAMRGRLPILPAVAADFKLLLDHERGVVVAHVTSAVRLEPSEIEAISARLREQTGSAIEIAAAVDPDLIGGLTVRLGDRLIDASVRGRLERLRDRLVAGAR